MAPEAYFDQCGFSDIGEDRAKQSVSRFAGSQPELSAYTIRLSFIKLVGVSLETFVSCYDKTRLQERVDLKERVRVNTCIYPNQKQLIEEWIRKPVNEFFDSVLPIEQQPTAIEGLLPESNRGQ